MNIVIENLRTRRSVRKYSKRKVSKKLIEQVAKAGTYAPTGRNCQSPIILAVTDKATRDKLSKLNAEVLKMDTDPFYGAPVVLVVLADKTQPTYINDGSLVMANLMIAAHSLGLATCWVHRAKEQFELPEGKELLKSLGIGKEYVGIANCILGYADGEAPKPHPIKNNYVHFVE